MVDNTIESKLDEMLKDYIRTAIAEKLGKNPEVLIKAVVDAALCQKKDSYSRETLFQVMVNSMIREEATTVFKEWLAEQRPLIREAVLARLRGEKGKFIETVADKLVEGMASSFYVSVYLKCQDDE